MEADAEVVLVTGSRTWSDERAIESWLRRRQPRKLLIGDARGADQLAMQAAFRLGIPYKIFAAKWYLYGRRAGILRNLAMLNEHPDSVIAFWDGRSIGTKHVVDEAWKRGIPVEIVRLL